jgi:curli biogenesis system outer membrane secretion channel CsgG
VEVTSVVQRVLVGGHHRMQGDVTLVDAKTGEVLLAYLAQTAIGVGGRGIAGTLIEQALAPEPMDRVVDTYAGQYSAWLLPIDPNGPI